MPSDALVHLLFTRNHTIAQGAVLNNKLSIPHNEQAGLVLWLKPQEEIVNFQASSGEAKACYLWKRR